MEVRREPANGWITYGCVTCPRQIGANGFLPAEVGVLDGVYGVDSPREVFICEVCLGDDEETLRSKIRNQADILLNLMPKHKVLGMNLYQYLGEDPFNPAVRSGETGKD